MISQLAYMYMYMCMPVQHVADNSFEVIIGDEDNMVSRLKFPYKDGEEEFYTSTPHILLCGEYR